MHTFPGRFAPRTPLREGNVGKPLWEPLGGKLMPRAPALGDPPMSNPAVRVTAPSYPVQMYTCLYHLFTLDKQRVRPSSFLDRSPLPPHSSRAIYLQKNCTSIVPLVLPLIIMHLLHISVSTKDAYNAAGCRWIIVLKSFLLPSLFISSSHDSHPNQASERTTRIHPKTAVHCTTYLS